jgi:hypothetical protein
MEALEQRSHLLAALCAQVAGNLTPFLGAMDVDELSEPLVLLFAKPIRQHCLLPAQYCCPRSAKEYRQACSLALRH